MSPLAGGEANAPQSTAATAKPRVEAKVIAAHYKVTERVILKWFAGDIIPGFRIGKKTVRFDFDAVVAAIEGGAK